MTDTKSEIRVEDMPSVDDVIVCQSVHGCNKAAKLMKVWSCCHHPRRIDDFICLDHYVAWVENHAGRLWTCKWSCGAEGQVPLAFARYREM